MRSLGFAGLLALAASARAQTPLVDSVIKLNRAGLWEQAGPLAQQGFQQAKTVDERCALLVGGSYALAQLTRLDAARATLRTFDRECVESPVVRQQATDIAFVRSSIDLPALPTTGVELSALDQFWTVTDLLRADVEPTSGQWRALLTTPTYRMVLTQNPNFRQHMSLAFKPSRRAERDSVVKNRANGAGTIAHLDRALAAREDIDRIRLALEKTLVDSVALAVRSAARLLPAGTTEKRPKPFIALGIYTYDGYAQGNGMILDALFVRENGLTDLMAHEFHHMYAGDFSRMSRAGIGAGDAPIIGVFWSLRNEGIADMVDKPYPLTVRSEAMASYAKGYNETYEKTPAVLRSIDSLIVGAIGDSAKLVAAAQQARTLIPWNGHPNGAYMARSIKDTFGVDSLFPALASPFAFVRVFRAAEAKKGNASAFSAPTIAWLDAMEKKYVP